MKSVVITEGESDVILLKALVGRKNEDIEFVKAGGWSGADSLARSYLADGRHNVALIVDADAYEPEQVEERRKFLRASLGSVALRTRWEVFVVAPEIEALLFADRHALEDLVGQTVSDAEFQEGKFEPKKVLMSLLSGKNRASFFRDRLAKIDLTPLQNQGQVKHLRSFLSGILKKQEEQP